MNDSESRPPRRVLRPFVPSPPGSPAVPRTPSPERSAPAVHRMPRPFTPSASAPAVAPRAEPAVETMRSSLEDTEVARPREDSPAEARPSGEVAAPESGGPQPSPLYEEAIESLSAFGTPDAKGEPAPGHGAGTASAQAGAEDGGWDAWAERGGEDGNASAEPQLLVGAEEAGDALRAPVGDADATDSAADATAAATDASDATSAVRDAGGQGLDDDRTLEWEAPRSPASVEDSDTGEFEAHGSPERGVAPPDEPLAAGTATPVMSNSMPPFAEPDDEPEPEPTELLAGTEFGWRSRAERAAATPAEADASWWGTTADRETPAESEVSDEDEPELPAALAEAADDWIDSDAGLASQTTADAPTAEEAAVDVAGEPGDTAGPARSHAGVVGALEELKEIEPWASPISEERDTDRGTAIAEALERLARRVRDGSLVLPADSHVRSDEGALAIALAALLRQSGR